MTFDEWEIRAEVGYIPLEDIPHGSIIVDPNRLRVCIDILFAESMQFLLERKGKLASQTGIKAYELKYYLNDFLNREDIP